MSIYIPGMEMPYDENDSIHILRDGTAVVYRAGSIDFYKAIPVPEHGRLIDADALLESEQGYTIPNYNSDGYVADLEGAYTEVQIENAPTIIPADSERQEKKKRYNLRLMWIADFDKWLNREPPLWKFWAWRRWKRERPVWVEVEE